MNYLLDTNVCVTLLSNISTSALRRKLQTQKQTADIFISSIVLFELWYGVAKSKRLSAFSRRSERLLSLGLDPLDLSAEDAEAAGLIRAQLEAQKQPIGPYDTLIAGQALARGLTLVTANHREFARIEGLRWEDWSALTPFP